MPSGVGYKYEVEIPGQGKFLVESAGELTDAQAYAAASGMGKTSSRPDMQARFSQSPNLGALTDTLADVPRLAGQGAMQTLQGFMDFPVGGAQLLSKLIPGQGAESAVSSYIRERERQYAPLTGAAKRPGEIQPGRIGGNIAFGVGISPSKLPATLLGRMQSGGKIGATMGALSPVDPDNPNFWTTKLLTTGLGGAAGFAAPPIIEGLSRGAAGVANWLGGKVGGIGKTVTGQTRPIAIESKLEFEFQRNGVDWSKLPLEMRDQMVARVQDALKSGGTLDDAATARLADFARLDIQPLQGQVTRNPYQWGNERNLGKTEVGAPIASRLGDQNRQMIGTLDRLAGDADQFAAGESAIQRARSVGQTQKQVVDEAYQAAREQAGLEADVPLTPVAQRIGQIIEEFGDDKIPAAVMKRLNQFGVLGDVTAGMHGGIKISGNQTKVFNIREAEKLKTLIGNNIDNPATPTGKALTLLKQSVDDAINSLADDTAGGAAAAAFREARGAASERFNILRRAPAMADVMDRTTRLAPEKFIEKYVVRGDVNSVKSLMEQIPQQERGAFQTGVLDWIRSKAIIGVGDTATVSAAQLERALKTIGQRKMAEIFTGNQAALDDLQALARVAAYIDRVPKGSGFNTSGSATAVIDFLDKMGRLPVLGAIAGKPGDVLRATQVVQALSPVPVMPGAPLIPQTAVNRFAMPAGLLGSPVAATIPPFLLGGSPLIEQQVRKNNERRY